MRFSIPKILVIVAVFSAFASTQALAKKERIEDGKKVQLKYTVKVDGNVIDTSEGEGKKPLEYVQGQGKIIKGLSESVAGLTIGDKKKIVVEPKDAYGEVNPENFRRLKLTDLPEGYEAEKGKIISMQTEDGRKIPGVIWAITEDEVVLNFNHPLAGKTLDIEVEVVSIEQPEDSVQQ